MPDHTNSAEIIAFPQRPDAVQPPTPEATALAEDAGERLQRALAMLQAAQAEQRTAVAKWRTAISSLDSSIQVLHGTLEQYQRDLADLTSTTRG